MPAPHNSSAAQPDVLLVESKSARSLERRLPLMISGLLVVTIAAFGLFAFREVRQSSIAAANGQLSTIILQTGANAGRTLTQRAGSLSVIRDNPSLIRAVSASASASDRQRAIQVLKGRHGSADSLTLASELFIDAAGAPTVVLGTAPAGIDSTVLSSTIADAKLRDSVTIGVPYATGDSMSYWMVLPIATERGARGFVAEQRRLRASPSIDQQLKGFTGQDISMYYAAVGAEVWTGLRGRPIKPKFDVSVLPDSFNITTNAGEKLLGVKSRLGNTSWFLVFTINEHAVTSRSESFLRKMLGTGLVLLLVGMFGAWWVSRRVTQPLKSLTVAAKQVAGGNFATRQQVHTQDELGDLAVAFNTMAERIGESHALLGARIEESEALATQLHRASEAKSEFLAMMSHELRTPLSAIAGYAEILQMGMRGELNDAQRLDLSRIQANQVHLLRIINDILDLAQVESGQLVVSTQPVAFRDVSTDLDPIVLPLIAAKNLQYSVHEELLPLTVIAERDRLTQVLVNLVANATRFTKDGGVILLHASRSNGRVQVHVTDTGVGIPVEKHEAIFQPFVQVESGASRRAQGTGLGLAISRRIVEGMGGTLTVKSQPGVGSTFTIDLQPVVVAAPAISPLQGDAPRLQPHAERRSQVMSPV